MDGFNSYICQRIYSLTEPDTNSIQFVFLGHCPEDLSRMCYRKTCSDAL